MNLSQKKNCNGCKAGWHENRPFTQICELRFKVTSENYTGIPLEPCYKPKTNSEYMTLREEFRLKENHDD